jgi:hypothetical protein
MRQTAIDAFDCRPCGLTELGSRRHQPFGQQQQQPQPQQNMQPKPTTVGHLLADAEDLRARAEHALRLAAAVNDDTAAANLRAMATELLERAQALEGGQLKKEP